MGKCQCPHGPVGTDSQVIPDGPGTRWHVPGFGGNVLFSGEQEAGHTQTVAAISKCVLHTVCVNSVY